MPAAHLKTPEFMRLRVGVGRPERGDHRPVADYVLSDFEPADDVPGGPRVVLLSDALWRRRFHGDRAIVGQTIRLDDNAIAIIDRPALEAMAH